MTAALHRDLADMKSVATRPLEGALAFIESQVAAATAVAAEYPDAVAECGRLLQASHGDDALDGDGSGSVGGADSSHNGGEALASWVHVRSVVVHL